MKIQLEHTFDAGHRIVGHKGKCARLHGHTYKAQVVVVGGVEDPGFVLDFGDIKDIIDEWDHRLLLWSEDPVVKSVMMVFSDSGDYSLDQAAEGIVVLPFNPTAENMAEYLAFRIGSLPGAVRKVKVTLWETPKSCATCEAVQL